MKYFGFTLISLALLISGAFAEAVGGPQHLKGRIAVGASATHSIEFVGAKTATVEVFCFELCNVTIYRPDGSVTFSKDANDNFDDGYEITIDSYPRDNTVYKVVIKSKATKEFGYDLKTNSGLSVLRRWASASKE